MRKFQQTQLPIIYSDSEQSKNTDAKTEHNELNLKHCQEEYLSSLKQLTKKKKQLQQMNNLLREKEIQRNEWKDKLLAQKQQKNIFIRRQQFISRQKKRQFQNIIAEQQNRLKQLDYTYKLLCDLSNHNREEYAAQQINKFNEMVRSEYDYLNKNNSKLKVVQILKLEDILLDNLKGIAQEMEDNKVQQ